ALGSQLAVDHRQARGGKIGDRGLHRHGCYMPIIHLKFKPDPSRVGPCVLIDPRPMRQLPLVERRTRVTWCGFWVRQGGTSPLTALPARHKGRHSLSRPDGGVVTQRTANPCTPVRFRLGPPPTILRLKSLVLLAKEWRGSTPFQRSISARRLVCKGDYASDSRHQSLRRIPGARFRANGPVTPWRLSPS